MNSRISKGVTSEIKKYKNSDFFKNVLKLFSGIGIAQFLIPLITTPLVTRLYSPEAFGKLGIFASIAGVAGSIVCLQYNKAIVLSKEIKDVINITFICLVLCMFFTLITTLIIIFFPENIKKVFDQDIALSFLYLVPALVFFKGVSLVTQSINVKYKYFGDISGSRILESSTNRGFVLALGFTGSTGPLVLILGLLIGQTLRALYLLKHIGGLLIRNINLVSINIANKLVIQYKKFPIYLSWSGLLFTLNEALPIWLISSHFSIEYAGYYTLVRGILLKPSKLISEAISQPYYQKIADQTDNKSFVHKITKQLMKRMISLTLLIYGGIAIFAPFIFPLVFGENWIEAGKIARILALFIGARFFTKSITMFFSAFGLQKNGLIMQASLLFIVVISFAFLSNFLNFYTVLTVYTIFSTFTLLGIIIYSYRKHIYSKIYK